MLQIDMLVPVIRKAPLAHVQACQLISISIRRSDTPAHRPANISTRMIAQKLPGGNRRHCTASIDYAPVQKLSEPIRQEVSQELGTNVSCPGERKRGDS